VVTGGSAERIGFLSSDDVVALAELQQYRDAVRLREEGRRVVAAQPREVVGVRCEVFARESAHRP